jgi:peptidoglycan/LPS O-acetylase OafA/YrhL
VVSAITKIGFDTRLESLRGLAAFGVAWIHVNIAFLTTEQVHYPEVVFWRDWLFRLFPPGSAVVFFFTLSGLVLSNSLLRDPSWKRFVIRRFCRIFPAMWFAVIVTYVAQITLRDLYDYKVVSEPYANMFLRHQGITDLFRNLILAKKSIDPVIWSLIPEMVCSLLLPGLVWIHRRLNAIFRLLLLALLTIWCNLTDDPTKYLFAFYAGFALPETITPFLRSDLIKYLAALFGWYLLYVGHFYGVAYSTIMVETCTVGSVLVISAVLSSPASFNFLNIRPVRFLGRISFSFYLLHLPVLFLLVALTMVFPSLRPINLYETVAFAVLAIAATIPVAALSYRFIELPGITFGRRLAEKSLPFSLGQRLSSQPRE